MGSTDLTADNIADYADTIQKWGGSLTVDADFLLYGCDVAADDRGIALVQKLSNLTGADVAASLNRTGSTAQGGDWDLEVTTGAIETGDILQPQTKADYSALLAEDKEKVRKEKKEKNKIKNKFARAKLFEILGDPDAVRINAGGEQFTDSSGKIWAADTNFVDGNVVNTLATVNQTKDSKLYQDGRRGSDFAYQIPVDKGKYQVNLSFVEDPYITGARQRLFDVVIEDKVALDDLDIWSQVGANTALNKTVDVSVTDGFLDLDFLSVAGDAKIEAIEVLSLDKKDKNKKDKPTATELAQTGLAQLNAANVAVANDLAIAASPAPTALINAGGGQYTDSQSQVWSADQYLTASNTYSTGTAITGTNDPTLYQTERFGTSFGYNIPVSASGTYTVALNFAEIYWNGPKQRVFDVLAEGQVVVDDLDIWSEVGANKALTKSIDVAVTDGTLNLNFAASIENAKVSSIQVSPSADGHGGHPFLHVVIGSPAWAVDYEGNGKEVIALQGNESHTHELGRQLSTFTWKDGNTLLGSTTDIEAALGLGNHQVSLTIGDDGVPSETLTDSIALKVFPINAVGGVLTKYYPGASISSLPTSPSFTEIVPSLRLEEKDGKVGASPISGNTAIVMNGKFSATTGGNYNFTVKGGTSSQVYVNGALVSGSIALTAGKAYNLEARIARDAAAVDPIEVLASVDGATAAPLNSTALTHDQSALKPIINNLSATKGSELGGQSIAINGVAFFDGDASTQVKVHWGNTILTEPKILVEQGVIMLVTPPGSGTVAVQVETPNGISTPINFTYEGATVPIAFTPQQAIASATPFAPTQAEWGPDGRLYVGAIDGEITIYTFDGSYNVTNTQKVTSLTNLANNSILGIAFNPFDASGSPKIYVSHSQLFANGGGAFTGTSPYSGQVSVLSGTDFSTVTPLITGLPVSNHDHGVNGLAFDNNGDLLIAVGGNTNAGKLISI